MRYLISAIALIMAAPVFAEGKPANPSQVFLKTFDADNNDQVSRDEYVKPQVQQIEKQFDYMDRNKDGNVDAGEAEAFAEEMRLKMQKMQKQR